ncbi:unnamed protein product [Paramecium octaurelia]|uniref:1-alkyl-2-acetylglycerophosphocholine esterase n=1 Tax=Paramecium octaurelia TaxID=43137 RepID=A0A8S1XFX7_PAROT|nr:unnamed protein product [Paramecium octaurelia]
MKYPYEFQQQDVPLLELALAILMLGSFFNDLLLILIYEIQIDLTEKSQMIFSTAFIILFMIKCQKMRLTIYLLIPAYITLILSKYWSHQSYFMVFLGLLFQIGYVSLVMVMPQYKYPKPTGKYLVGFREMKLQNGDLVSIYYPTLQKSKIRSINSCRNRDYIKQVYNDFQHVMHWRPPIMFIYWMLGFLNKVKVEDIEVDSPIIDGKLPTIVFSNGLGGLKDHYSVFYKEWASNGYQVYSIQQEEVTIILNEKEIHQYKTGEATLENQLGQQILGKVKMIRHQQLNDRVTKFQSLLDYVYKQQNVDFNKVIGAGHSFGAATVHRSAQIDKRISAGIILFDPWFLPFSEDTLNIKLSVPLLSVNSETFRLRKENETPQRYSVVFNAQQKKLVIMIKGSQHLCTTDLVYKMPFELKMFTKLNNLNKILQITIAHLRLSQYFIESLSPQKTLTKFEEFSKESFRQPIHEIEYK